MDIEELILLPEHSQLLVMNSWRHEILHEQRNIIIAEALNSCTVHKGFKLLGYLITNRRLFLIGSSEVTPFQEVLQYFYHQVSLGIINYKKMLNLYHDDTYLLPKNTDELFTKYPFYNVYIRNLITGKEVNSKYYDPRLSRLKNYIHNHKYSSAVDYAGGKSPVIVDTSAIII
ncbi:hypothetical protein U8527_02510 [Kordia algicida OT-1]|uniref:Uncharacterized protein n=1 Tax=Kordia algicida OT-1 TaxID=391587 RepID=A9DNG1_9FLAO|nr:hypothetical protein [Kordia algicida]EDP97183.1 hypothetical protein KAOT1_18512 [Kordia algicida OT-1]